MQGHKMYNQRWQNSVQWPEFLVVQSQVWGTTDISPLSKGQQSCEFMFLKTKAAYNINVILSVEKTNSKPLAKVWFQYLSNQYYQLEKMRLDFVFQDMSFELDVNPLAAFKHLHTLDLNFYDNHRYFVNKAFDFARGDKSKKNFLDMGVLRHVHQWTWTVHSSDLLEWSQYSLAWLKSKSL